MMTYLTRFTILIDGMDARVQSFIDTNGLWSALYIAEATKQELTQKNIPAKLQVIVDSDSEAPEHEELILAFSIGNKEYSEILQLWNTVSRDVYSKLPSVISEKVCVRLVKG